MNETKEKYIREFSWIDGRVAWSAADSTDYNGWDLQSPKKYDLNKLRHRIKFLLCKNEWLYFEDACLRSCVVYFE